MQVASVGEPEVEPEAGDEPKAQVIMPEKNTAKVDGEQKGML